MNIIVVSPHPDDETLGAGGALLKMKQEGHAIFWLNVTDIKVTYGFDEKFVEARTEQIKKIFHFYNFDGMCNLAFPPTKLEGLGKTEIIDKVNRYFKKIQPDWIILPDGNDAHSDHRVVFEACLSCSKIFRQPSIKRIMTMEIISETDFGKPYYAFVPNYFIDITDYMERKLEAMKIYDTEISHAPFPRCIETIRSQANVRGAAAGSMYAEAFQVIKMIE